MVFSASSRARVQTMAVRALLVLSVLAVLYGCEQASSSAERQEQAARVEKAAAEPAPEPTTSSAGGIAVGPVFAKVDLEPVGGSSTRGTVVFKKVGDSGVQVELAASGLPKPQADYFAQIHEGSCTGAREQEDNGDHRHEQDGDHDHEHGGVGPAMALVRLDTLLAKGLKQAHSGHDHSAPAADELPGDIDYPIAFSSSTDGTAFVTTWLESVAPEEVVSGKPKYIDLHPLDSGDSRTLACADLSDAN
jgi:hypothetical protein